MLPPKSPESPTSALACPRLRVVIANVLFTHGVPRNELRDLVQETLLRILALAVGSRRTNTPTPLAVGIARNVARENLRRHLSNSRYNIGFCETPDMAPSSDPSAEDRAELRQEVAMVASHFETGLLSAKDLTILRFVADDVPHDEIAKELGLSRQTIRNRLCRMRRIALERSRAAASREAAAPKSRRPRVSLR